MPLSVGVIGTGWVGASVAISVLHAGIGSELLLADARTEVAESAAPARPRQVVGQGIGVAPHSVHAQVVGEHGDSEVVLWSSASVGGTPLRQWHGWSGDREGAIATEVRTAAYEIIRRKGATNHA